MTDVIEVHPLDIQNEEYREYRYGNGQVLRITDPFQLYLMPNGSHRVVDKEGVCHRPTPNFLCISWKQRDGKPFSF